MAYIHLNQCAVNDGARIENLDNY